MERPNGYETDTAAADDPKLGKDRVEEERSRHPERPRCLLRAKRQRRDDVVVTESCLGFDHASSIDAKSRSSTSGIPPVTTVRS